jgi:RimJ/RimL family protein N-acetyltransferase
MGYEKVFNNDSKNNKILDYSPIESSRFGMRVYRGIVDEINPNMILSNIISEKVDVAIIRLPSEKQDQLSWLNEVGLPYIVADTLVYYNVDLLHREVGELKNKELSFVQCCKEHNEILESLVGEIFKGYTNHYNSNPFMSKCDILQGYKEWARSFITDNESGKVVWLIKREESYIGFACCTYDAHKCTAVLYGIASEASGRGIYSDVIRFTQRYFKDMGYKIMEISTQIQNLASQKAWIREGAVLNKSYITLHINSFMNCSVIKKETFNINIPAQMANKLCNDIDIIASNDNKGLSRNLENSSTFLAIINFLVLNFYSVQYPGNKSAIKIQTQQILQPLKTESDYRAIVSFPYIDSSKGVCKSLILLKDEQDNLCYFSYIDLHV